MYDRLKTFRFWCNKVLPLVYDDSLSYYEVLCKVVDYLNKMLENENYLNEVLEVHGVKLEDLRKETDYLVSELDKVKKGDYVSLYLESIKAWIDNNIQDLVAGIVKYVMFGLTDDGHFCAYIPKSWDFIKFDTVVDMNSELYGHLIMRW